MERIRLHGPWVRSESRIVCKVIVIAILLSAWFGMAADIPAEEATVQIIGNKSLPFDTLSRNDLLDIFKQTKTLWDQEVNINITLLQEGETHRRFVWQYFHKTPSQYHRYWKKLVFSGKGRTPITFRSEKDLMSHVALTKGAIGYISENTKPVGVKIIKISD